MAFETRPAVIGDLDAITRINLTAFAAIPIFSATTADAQPDALFAFWRAFTQKRMLDARFRYFVAVDTQTGQVVGCAGIALPGDPGTPAKPVWPEGMNTTLAEYFFGSLLMGKKREHGLRETEDCQRAGMFILPEYQKRGLGRLLSEHCDAAADGVRARTYVVAMGSALKIFLDGGFRVLETADVPLAEHGGPDVVQRAYVLFRPAADRDGGTTE